MLDVVENAAQDLGEPGPSDGLASWSGWLPFAVAAAEAPRTPGVYQARVGAAGPLVYVGMAGERRGQGVRGRLTVYRRGRGAVSGLGEAALDRALADVTWLRERLERVEAGAVWRTRDWATAALERLDLHVRWAVTVDGDAARRLEREALDALVDVELWNRLR